MFNRSKSYRAAPVTKLEIEYMGLVRSLPCLCCARALIFRKAVLHHIKSGNKRMGHRFVLPLCTAHHVGTFIPGQKYGAEYSVHKQHRMFVETFGTERQLWERTQELLDLPVTGWPESKILPRRIANTEDWA